MTTANFALPAINTFEQLVDKAAGAVKGNPLRAAVVAPYHADFFRACKRAIDTGLIAPVMIGRGEQVRKADAEAGVDLGKVELLETESDEAAIERALRLSSDGTIDMIIKGSVPIPFFIRHLVSKEHGFVPKGRFAGHVAVIKPVRYRKLLFLTDPGVIVQPDLKHKIALLQNLIGYMTTVGIETPRIAVLAAVEVVYPQMPVTIEAAVLSKMNERGQIKGAYIDGPLSFDCAVDRIAAESKGIRNSEVAGQADGMLAPNIETAHGIYKAMALFGNARMGGVVYGGRIPVALAATSDTVDRIFDSIVLAALAR